jgi:hypothetical protein
MHRLVQQAFVELMTRVFLFSQERLQSLKPLKVSHVFLCYVVSIHSLIDLLMIFALLIPFLFGVMARLLVTLCTYEIYDFQVSCAS